MATKFSGGCACGAVRYECQADPIFMGNCHCRDCQRASGGGMTRRSESLQRRSRSRGNVKYHECKADNGNTLSRGFCPECGSRLFGKTSGMTDLAMFTAGSLDDPTQYTPSMDIFTSSAQPWDHMNPALPKFPKMPM